jgi:hypothetical protein
MVAGMLALVACSSPEPQVTVSDLNWACAPARPAASPGSSRPSGPRIGSASFHSATAEPLRGRRGALATPEAHPSPCLAP